MPGAVICRHKMINRIKFLKKKIQKSHFLKVLLSVLVHFHTVVKVRELRQKMKEGCTVLTTIMIQHQLTSV